MDLVTAARHRLTTAPGFAALVGTDVGTSPEWGGPWIFDQVDAAGLPPVEVEGTGTSAVVVTLERSPVGPSRTSMRFRTVRVLIFAADSLPADGVTVRDARDRVERVTDAVVRALGDAGFSGGWWGALYVCASHLQADLSILDVPGGGGVVRGDVAFDVASA